LHGMDFRLRKTRVFRIAGKTSAAAGASIRTTVSLLAKDQAGIGARDSLEPPIGGAFEFNRLLAGSYIVSAYSVAPSPQQPQLFGRQSVTIGGGSVEDLVLQLAPGAEITVRFRSEESETPLPRVRMTLSSTEDSIVNNAQLRPDGTPVFTSVRPSIYRVLPDSLPEGTYVKSMRFGDQDVTRKPLDLTSGAGGILEVVLSPHAADVSGVTTPGLTVTLWDGPDFIRTTGAAANGSFRFTNLPPGEFHIAAWEQIDPGFSELPEFLAKFEDRAARLKLSENAHENVTLDIVKRDVIEVAANTLR